MTSMNINNFISLDFLLSLFATSCWVARICYEFLLLLPTFYFGGASTYCVKLFFLGFYSSSPRSYLPSSLQSPMLQPGLLLAPARLRILPLLTPFSHPFLPAPSHSPPSPPPPSAFTPTHFSPLLLTPPLPPRCPHPSLQQPFLPTPFYPTWYLDAPQLDCTGRLVEDYFAEL